MMEQTHEMRNTPDSFLPFDPIVVVQDVLKRWLIILLAAIAVGVGTYIMTDMEYAPRYQAKATFVVTSRSSAATVYSNLTSTTEMASVFSELINSSVMRKNIQEVLGGYFSATISASAVPQTNLLNMTVTASDPRTAFLVAQAIIDHHEEITYQVVDGVSLEILQGVEVPTVPVNRANAVSRMEKMMLLAGAAAVVLKDVPDNCTVVGNPGRIVQKKKPQKRNGCSSQAGAPQGAPPQLLQKFLWVRVTRPLTAALPSAARSLSGFRNRQGESIRLHGGTLLGIAGRQLRAVSARRERGLRPSAWQALPREPRQHLREGLGASCRSVSKHGEPTGAPAY